MSTRSNIAIENRNGSITSLYCHYDGYLSNNGKILAEHYSDPKKVRELFSGNGFRSLTTDPKDLDRYEGADDKYEHRTEYSFVDASDSLFIEYLYLYKDGRWYVSESKRLDTEDGYNECVFYYSKFEPLHKALFKLEEVA
jgi:hypothetical protein